MFVSLAQEIRWECQRLFFGGSTVLTGSFDPWLELTAYIIEGLTAEETELYLWQALLVRVAPSLSRFPHVFHLLPVDFSTDDLSGP